MNKIIFLLFCLLSADCRAESIFLYMINVSNPGPGDSYLIINDDKVLMIDLGTELAANQSIIPLLAQLNISHIDDVVITHPHNDHIGGLNALVNNHISIGNLYYNRPPNPLSDFAYDPIIIDALINTVSMLGTTIHDVNTGDKISAAIKLHVVYAHKSLMVDDLGTARVNDFSIVTRARINNVPFLFTGDLDYKVGTKLLNGFNLNTTILDVPHHGVTPMVPREFLNKTNPIFALIPTNSILIRDVRFDRTRNWLQDTQIKYCTNGENGTVKLIIDLNKISIHPDIPSSNCSGEIEIPTPPTNIKVLPAIIDLIIN